jgi:hypothetical protein
MTYAMPGIGTSLFLIAAGAILRYAVTLAVTGVALRTVGLILMIVGGVGLAISIVLLILRVRRSAHTDPSRETIVERESSYD